MAKEPVEVRSLFWLLFWLEKPSGVAATRRRIKASALRVDVLAVESARVDTQLATPEGSSQVISFADYS